MKKSKRYKFPYSWDELTEKVKALTDRLGSLTVRQIYYQLVADRLKNCLRAYHNLSGKLTDLRRQGKISCDSINDKGRRAEKGSSWTSPKEFFQTVSQAYRRDPQQGQPIYMEIWSEKVVAITDLADKYDITARTGDGFPSISAIYEASKRFKKAKKPGLILYLGDFDPSGLSMTNAMENDFKNTFHVDVDIHRVLLLEEDIDKYHLPQHHKVKTGDSRAVKFIAAHGPYAYGLDSLSQDVISERLEAAIMENMDMKLYEKQLELEEEDKVEVAEFIEAWNAR